MTDFDDIRPYRDDEVRSVIERLMNDKRLFSVVARYKFPFLSRFMPDLIAWLIRSKVKHDLSDVDTIEKFQRLVVDFMARTVKNSTNGLSYTGIDKLDPNQSYLFVSNHRDIAMDPAFLNYALHLNGFNTFEIAIGDNLLTNPLATDIMRLNRSFIVKRSVEGIRPKLAAMTKLSEYIKYTLDNNTSVWIAQREGRAKDGLDKTDPAILKMFYIHGKKLKLSFSDYMNRLNIVPVAISYEYDPCDYLKARELEAKFRHHHYEKAEDEDIQSIIQGISKPKGRVHIGVGTPLKGELESAEQVAHLIDQQIKENYRIYASNLAALESLSSSNGNWSTLPDLKREIIMDVCEKVHHTDGIVEGTDFATKASEFKKRISQYPQNLQRYVLEMYANPIINKYLDLKGSQQI